jgi:hypothetical protein
MEVALGGRRIGEKQAVREGLHIRGLRWGGAVRHGEGGCRGRVTHGGEGGRQGGGRRQDDEDNEIDLGEIVAKSRSGMRRAL